MQETKGHTRHILKENEYNQKIKEILSTQTIHLHYSQTQHQLFNLKEGLHNKYIPMYLYSYKHRIRKQSKFRQTTKLRKPDNSIGTHTFSPLKESNKKLQDHSFADISFSNKERESNKKLHQNHLNDY